MKRKLIKIFSMILALMLVMTTAFACVASAATTVVKDNSSLNNANSAAGTATKFTGPRDIYLVLDISGSMSGTPIKNLKVAAKQFCNLMIQDKTGTNRIAIITYGTKVNSYSFSNDYQNLANTIDALKAKGSTDMYDALMAVKTMNEKAGNDNATKHVVVMADGLPNESATLSTGKYTSKDSTLYYKYGNAVYSTAAGMWPDYLIYSIGFFHSLGGSELKYGKTLMKDIQNALYQDVPNADGILNAFLGIAEEITKDGADKTTSTTKIDGANNNESKNTTKIDGANNNVNINGNGNGNGGSNGSGTGTSIPKTGDAKIGVAVAAIVMLAGIGFVATKKHED